MNVTVNIQDNSENQQYCWDEKAVEEFRSLVKSQEDLRSRLDDAFLLSCLRARKYNPQRALELVKNYYATKRRYPHIFQNVDSSTVEKCLNADVLGYLPYTDNLGRLILVYRAAKWNVDELGANDIACLGLLYGDLLLNVNSVQVNGVVVLLDMSGLSMKMVMRFTPTLALQLMKAIKGVYPISCKELHLVNISYIFLSVSLKLLLLLSNKISKRVHIHSDLDSLHQYIPKKYLPSEFGGAMPPLDFAHCSSEFRSNKQYFRENQKYWMNNHVVE